jgi:hypothetical protein
MSFNIVNVSLALENIKNIFIFYKNINIIINNLYDVLQKMLLLCDKYINTTLMNDKKDSLGKEYDLLLGQLSLMENIKYNGLQIIKFKESVQIVIDPSTKLVIPNILSTVYRFYIYINTIDNTNSYTEYDNAFGVLTIGSFKDIETGEYTDNLCVEQISKLTSLIKTVTDKICSINTWYEILKEQAKIYKNMIKTKNHNDNESSSDVEDCVKIKKCKKSSNINKYKESRLREINVNQCIKGGTIENVENEYKNKYIKIIEDKNNKREVEKNIYEFKREYKREIKRYIKMLLEKINKLEEKNRKYKRYIKRIRR